MNKKNTNNLIKDVDNNYKKLKGYIFLKHFKFLLMFGFF